MRRGLKIYFLTLIILLVFNSLVISDGERKDVYVIPVKGEINRSTYEFLKAELEVVSKNNPAAVIFEIDTYGGLIVEAEKIKDLIINLHYPTISFVNTKAESAGVLITISSEKIAMAEGSTIGSAETIPNTEKILSTWVSMLKSVAIQRGRDSQLVAAMADKTIEIEGLVNKGSLLNLNYKQAKELEFADTVANNYKDILENFNIDYDSIIEVGKDFRVEIASFLTGTYIASLLLSIAFIGLFIEIFAPGFGAGGTISLIAFTLFFGGNILAGNSSWGPLIIFLGGAVLILIEVIIPGFGFPGAGGIITIIISIIVASGSFERAIGTLSISILITTIAIFLLIRYGPKNSLFSKIVLNAKQGKMGRYVSTVSREDYLNMEGVTVTDLRPVGTIDIKGDRIEAVSEGDFIEKGSKVRVQKIHGFRVIVRKI